MICELEIDSFDPITDSKTFLLSYALVIIPRHFLLIRSCCRQNIKRRIQSFWEMIWLLLYRLITFCTVTRWFAGILNSATRAISMFGWRLLVRVAILLNHLPLLLLLLLVVDGVLRYIFIPLCSVHAYHTLDNTLIVAGGQRLRFVLCLSASMIIGARTKHVRRLYLQSLLPVLKTSAAFR